MTPLEKFTAYMRWLRFIHETHPELPEGIRRSTLLAYCQAQARDGSYGLGCYASDTRIARELEIKQRSYIAPYRKLAIELGWFVPNGKKDRRVAGLDIAIPRPAGNPAPEDQPTSGKLDRPAGNSAAHTGDDAGQCPACVPLRRKVYDGEMTVDQVLEVHRQSSRSP